MRAVAALLTASAVTLLPASAAAGTGDNATDPPPFVGAGYVIEDGQPGVVAGYVEAPVEVTTVDPGRRSAAARRICGWYDQAAEFVFTPTPTSVLRAGSTYVLACRAVDTGALVYADYRRWEPGRPGGGVVTTTEDLVAFTRDRFVFDAPVVATAPPPTANVVGIATWLGVATPAPQTRTAQAGPLWATATATPTAVTFTTARTAPNPGAGGPADAPTNATCSPIPPPLDPRVEPPGCAAVRWRWSGDHTVTATITYDVVVTTGDLSAGSATGPEPVAPVVGPATTVAVVVRELEAVIR